MLYATTCLGVHVVPWVSYLSKLRACVRARALLGAMVVMIGVACLALRVCLALVSVCMTCFCACVRACLRVRTYLVDLGARAGACNTAPGYGGSGTASAAERFSRVPKE